MLTFREKRIIESRNCPIDLTKDQAAKLNQMGRDLASDEKWWGASGDTDKSKRSVIRCQRDDDGKWEIRVRDAIGVITVEDLQIMIDPKISIDHFCHIMAKGTPRLEPSPSFLTKDDSFFEVIARWYIAALEKLLTTGLIRDYRSKRDSLNVVRGRIDLQQTINDLMSGKALITSEFEEFDQDNPLNRTLLKAALVVSASPILSQEIRNRARRATRQIDDVGLFEKSDLSATLERRTAYYQDPINLAKNIILGYNQSLNHGLTSAKCFLFKTPYLVEEGIREILRTAFNPQWKIGKKGIKLGASGLKVTPDLVFNSHLATGDVKYKFAKKDWNRNDLYQAVTFATAFKAKDACVISFDDSPDNVPKKVDVGDVRLTPMSWRTHDSSPQQAQENLIENVRIWLLEVESRAQSESPKA